MDIGFEQYFHILNKNWAGEGGTLDTPRGVTTQNIKKNVLGHVTYQSKANEKLYSNMSIKCSFDRQQQKKTGI